MLGFSLYERPDLIEWDGDSLIGGADLRYSEVNLPQVSSVPVPCAIPAIGSQPFSPVDVARFRRLDKIYQDIKDALGGRQRPGVRLAAAAMKAGISQ